VRTNGLQVLIDRSWQGKRWVVETDVANCFEAIPFDKLMQAVEERVSDRGVLRLVRMMLRAGVMQHGRVRRPATGTPQGGVISRLLANIFLHRLDRAWDEREHGVLVRYADLCRTRHKSAYAACRVMPHGRRDRRGSRGWPRTHAA
jgi:RNA-directed DNA polymerase